MAELPLTGIRMAMTALMKAGPNVGMLLGDWGAEVITLESTHFFTPATRGAFFARPPQAWVDSTKGFLFRWPNREIGERPWNRVSVTNSHCRNALSASIELERPKGPEMLKRLIKKCDVFLDSQPYGRLAKWGIHFEELMEINPRLIVVAMGPFGTTGPYKEFTLLGGHIDGHTGHTWIKSYRDEDIFDTSYIFHTDNASPLTTVFAIVAALHHREKTGKGQFIDAAQSEAIFSQLAQPFMDYTMNKRIWGPQGNRDQSAVQGCYQALGGEEDEGNWVVLTISNDEEWQGFCRALGNPEWTKDEKFSNSFSRYQNHNELDDLIGKWTAERDKYDIFHLLQKEGVPAAPVINERDAYNDPHYRARGFWEEVTHEDCGTHDYPGIPWKASKTPASIRKPPCRLGEHNEYVYKELIGVTDEEYEELDKEGHISLDFAPDVA